MNYFNNNKRFTGTTGGYQSELDNLYYDANGVATTDVLAFPDSIVLDWSAYDQVSGDVFGVLRLRNIPTGTTEEVANAIPACASYSVGAFTSGWFLPNEKELMTTFMRSGTQRHFDYVPVSGLAVISAGTQMWTSTKYEASANYKIINANGGVGNSGVIARAYTAGRYFNITEL